MLQYLRPENLLYADGRAVPGGNAQNRNGISRSGIERGDHVVPAGPEVPRHTPIFPAVARDNLPPCAKHLPHDAPECDEYAVLTHR